MFSLEKALLKIKMDFVQWKKKDAGIQTKKKSIKNLYHQKLPRKVYSDFEEVNYVRKNFT